MKLLYQENTWEDLEKAAKEGYIVVLPVGVVEQHGPQLPVGTDNYLAENLAIEGAKEAKEKHGVKVIVLPTLNYGAAMCCENFPGTISLPVETYIRFVSDIIKKLILRRFKKWLLSTGMEKTISLLRRYVQSNENICCRY